MNADAKAEIVRLLEASVFKALENLDSANSLKRQSSPPEGYSPALRQIFAAYDTTTRKLANEISDVIHELDVPEAEEEDEPGAVQEGGGRGYARRRLRKIKSKSRKTRRSKRKN